MSGRAGADRPPAGDPGAPGNSPPSLRVLEIFDSLQGEGYWTGVPMTFVRLAGCNAPGLGLDCTRWCDTRDSWSATAGEDVDVQAIIERVKYPRMCLTGGEPLLQLQGVAGLLDAAHAGGIRVHVETNGTIGPRLPAGRAATTATARLGAAESFACLEFDWVVVSPKPPSYDIVAGWEGLVDELKLVADELLEAAVAERLADNHPGAFVCIQPLAVSTEIVPGPGGLNTSASSDREAKASVERAIDLVMSHPEWRLSLQTHRYLGIR